MHKKTRIYVLRTGIVLCALLFALLLEDDRLLEHVLQSNQVTIEPTQTLLYFNATTTPIVYGTVTRVIDGDTVVLQPLQSQQEIKVRLLGVDAPESVHPTKPVECFGKEASLFLKEMVEGKEVYIETDPSQGAVDRYGRTLAYVFLNDGTSVNERLLSEGYAYEYTYDGVYLYQADFRHATAVAQAEGRGLWSMGMCSEK